MWTFYYDGDCNLCARAVEWLSRADLSRRIRWVPFQSLSEAPEGVTWDDLRRSAYLEGEDGRLYEGFYAVRMLTLRVWALIGLAPLLWLPGAHLAGALVYRWVARNRCRTPAD